MLGGLVLAGSVDGDVEDLGLKQAGGSGCLGRQPGEPDEHEPALGSSACGEMDSPADASLAGDSVNVRSVGGERVSLFPTSIRTSAPRTGPSVTATDENSTGLPMSRIRPVPLLSPPNLGLLT
jgi:hypothetical protein